MALQPLLQFNDRVERLEKSRFLIWLLSGPKEPNYMEIALGTWLAYSDLHPDDLTAFCTNLRMLILNKDGFSISCVAEVYKNLPEEFQEAKNLIQKARVELNDFLLKKSHVSLNGKKITNNEFFEIFLYADIVHGKDKHSENFQNLATKAGIFSTLSFYHLVNILLHHRNCFKRIATLNTVILENYQTSND